MFKIQKIWRLITIAALLAGALNLSIVPVTPVYADSTAQTLPFSQRWSNTGLITVDDDWSGVPGVTSYLGQGLTTATGVDPQTVLTESVTPGDLTVLANQTVTTGFSGDVAEFEITDPVVGFQGSGTADAPYVLISLDTTGKSAINISYNLRDIDGTTDNAIQPVALQYRVGSTGDFTNVPAGFVADATTGPSLATLITPVNVTLPGAVDNQTLVQVRIITANAVGSDEWVGIDDISVTGNNLSSPNLTINDVTLAEGNAGTTTFTFTVSLASAAPAGNVTFNIATIDGTATTADNDYVANSVTSQTIVAGNSSSTFDVTVNDDTTAEPDETFFVNVTNATNATITDSQGVGTITNDDAVLPVLTINDVTLTEGNAGTGLASFTVSLDIPAGPSGVTFNIATADGTATTADSDYVLNSITGATIAASSQTYTFDVTVNGDAIAEQDETFTVNVTGVTGATLGDGVGLGTITNDDITPIYTIQGSGLASGMVGSTVITEGVVVGDYEGGFSPQIRGFYIQDATGDANPGTSDGIFVFDGNSADFVSVGDLVRVTGTVSEYNDQTQISTGTIAVLSSSNTITPTDIVLPFASAAEQEQYESMLVRVPQTLTVTEMYLLGRFGQVTLSGAGKLYQPTNIVAPGAPAIAMQAANNLNKIIVDDASQSQNPDPILFGRGGNPLSASNTLRGGDTIANLVGVFTYTWGGNSSSPNAYRIRPINAMGGGGVPNFVAANARPTVAPVVGGTVKAVGMNVLNYFNTFDGIPDLVDNCANGVGGTAADCRGADDATEFTRQSDKIVNAILALDADVIGVVEIENDGYDSASAIQDLVNKLNAATALGTYAFINPDTTLEVNSLGLDAIKVGLLYQPARVTPVGTTAALNTVAFINGGDSAPRNRASLLQAFQSTSGEKFLVNVNHLKSKGSACDVADAGDGQGNCNLVRLAAVNELLTWFAADPTGTGDPDLLIVGDLNSYAKEDPIAAFETAGYTNLAAQFEGASAYSYVFNGQWGYLDYGLASPSLLAQTAGFADWHINADEPSVLDYNTNFKTAGQITDLYSPEPFRTSDHDPVLVGLNLDSVAPTVVSSLRADPNPTSAASVNFTVTFSEPVTGVDVNDFILIATNVTGASVTSVTPVSATVYTVTVNTGTGSGTLRLDIPNSATIADLAGNPLAGLPYLTGDAYTVRWYTLFLPLIFR